MKFTSILLTATLTIGATSAQAFEFPQIRLDDGSTRMAVPLPPARGQAGSVYAIVSRAAAQNGVPSRLAHAVIKIESGHNCHARNRSGAAGLGQLMPGTARKMGVRNPMSCEQNAQGAMRYLAIMLRQARGNWCAAVSGYNSGHVGGCTAYGRKVLRYASL